MYGYSSTLHAQNTHGVQKTTMDPLVLKFISIDTTTLVYAVLWIWIRALCMLGKHSTNWTTSLALKQLYPEKKSTHRKIQSYAALVQQCKRCAQSQCGLNVGDNCAQTSHCQTPHSFFFFYQIFDQCLLLLKESLIRNFDF